MNDVTDLITIKRINGNIDRGGWEMEFTVPNDTDLFRMYQRISLSWMPAFGTSTAASRAGFTGYVMSRRFSFTGKDSISTYLARTSDGFLEKGWLQGISFADIGAASREHYHQFDSVTGGGDRMTLGKIVRHLLGYNDELGCTASPAGDDWISHTGMVYHAEKNPDGWIRLTNVVTEAWAADNPNGSMRVNKYIVEETNNMWATLQQIARNEFFIIGFDKSDTVYYHRHPMFAETLKDVKATFDASVIIDAPVVQYRDVLDVSQVRLHAVTDEGNTLHSSYPAADAVTGTRRRMDISYIRCNNQSTLDDWAKYRYYYETRQFEVTITLPGLCGLLFDLLDRVAITYTGTDANGVHIDWKKKKFWIHDITITPDNTGSGKTELVLHEENRPA